MKAKLIKYDYGYGLGDCELIAFVSKNRPTHKHYKLSLKNCEAIERGYDLDELAEEIYPICNLGLNSTTSLHTLHQESFKVGFKKALEIIGDKKYSEQDTVSFGRFISKIDCLNFELPDGSLSHGNINLLLDYWKSLQKTEWDVELNPDELDKDGCLILKRIK